jgi:hypothetical protein
MTVRIVMKTPFAIPSIRATTKALGDNELSGPSAIVATRAATNCTAFNAIAPPTKNSRRKASRRQK